MGHGSHHHHHHHPDPGEGAEGRLLGVMVLTGTFMVAEVVGGLISGSLALLADAGHMLTDTAALAIAFAAARAARRPPDQDRSYGYRRTEVLAAFVNGGILIAIVGWIVVEAFQRLLAPVPVLGGTMAVVAALGLAVNLVAFLLLRRGAEHNLNQRGALMHVLGDMLGSVAALVAAAVILLTGWTPIDPLLSLFVAALILRGAWFLVRESAHILLEGSPAETDTTEIKRLLPAAVPGVRDVHHVHVWSLAPGHPLLTMHVMLGPDGDGREVLRQIKGLLQERFGITHATVQIEQGACVDEER